jgi:UrcA family protein
MNSIANLKTIARAAIHCVAGCLLITPASYAADGGIATAPLPSATWQQAAQYVIQRLPDCKEYPQSAVASIRGDRISLYFADLNYGTTDSFPLRDRFTAEAHSADGHWRLFVRFPGDVVTTDVPSWNGRGRSNVFSCDGDRDTTQGLATALTQLRDLLSGGFSLGEQNAGLPEVTVRDRREGVVTLTERVNVADLDLSTRKGTEELRARITTTARGVCRQLEILYPDFGSASGHEFTHESCVRDAVAEATKRVDERIAALQKQ